MKGYKAFEKGMICRGKQYAENTVFEEEKAEICISGMHFCKEPLDVLDYYPLIDENGNMTEFAEVEALDEPKTSDGKKFCTKKLKIGAKISFAKLVQASVISTLNNDVQIVSSGYAARIGNSDHNARIASSGNEAQIGNSGSCARIASSGNEAQIGNSGSCARIASSGNNARMVISGSYTQIASSGYSCVIASSSDFAQIGSSGNYAQINSTGKYAVICCAGEDCIAKGKIGSWITLSEWKYSKEEKTIIPVCVKTEKIDGIKIKEDTFYKLKNGKFVEVKRR